MKPPFRRLLYCASPQTCTITQPCVMGFSLKIDNLQVLYVSAQYPPSSSLNQSQHSPYSHSLGKVSNCRVVHNVYQRSWHYMPATKWFWGIYDELRDVPRTTEWSIHGVRGKVPTETMEIVEISGCEIANFMSWRSKQISNNVISLSTFSGYPRHSILFLNELRD